MNATCPKCGSKDTRLYKNNFCCYECGNFFKNPTTMNNLFRKVKCSDRLPEENNDGRGKSDTVFLIDIDGSFNHGYYDYVLDYWACPKNPDYWLEPVTVPSDEDVDIYRAADKYAERENEVAIQVISFDAFVAGVKWILNKLNQQP